MLFVLIASPDHRHIRLLFRPVAKPDLTPVKPIVISDDSDEEGAPFPRSSLRRLAERLGLCLQQGGRRGRALHVMPLEAKPAGVKHLEPGASLVLTFGAIYNDVYCIYCAIGETM